MSDARLREAERTFATTGSVADEAALLRERLRVGAITQHNVEVALNCLGYPAAFAVLGGENDTWEYWRPDRLPHELASITVEHGGITMPLGVLVAIPFAQEMACVLEEVASDRYRVPEMRPYLQLARSLLRKRRAVTAAQIELAQAVVALVNSSRGVDSVDDVQLMYAIIVFAAQASTNPICYLQLIFRLFLRERTFVGHRYVTRHYWARRAILKVAIPHLLGHASMVPHCEHLHEAKRRIPPERWRAERTPER